MADQIEVTRVYATEPWPSGQVRDVHVQVGMHRLQKVCRVEVQAGCKVVTAEELATVLSEYIDAKLARAKGETA